MASDNFEKYDFSFPDLSEEIKGDLMKFWSAPGSILKNPVDTPIIFINPNAFENILQMLNDWNEVDLVVLHHGYDIPGGPHTQLSDAIAAMIDAAKVITKPAALVLYCATDPESYKAFINDQQRGWEAGIPSFNSMESAAEALHKFACYHQRKGRH